MRTIRNTAGPVALLLALTIGFSCKDNDPIRGDATSNTNINGDSAARDIAANININNWILANMQMVYYWNEHIPSATDKTLSPEKYFDALLYKLEDRFSWIQENYTDLLNYLSGIQKEAGYDYSLMYADAAQQNIVGIINYIKPHSPASGTDLKRGDIFSAINGTRITVDNYSALIDALSEPHTLGIIELGKGLNPVKSVSLPVAVYEENPVFLDTVYYIGDKKIGYLVYNFFAEDNGDYSNSYTKELNGIFGDFRAVGVDELILDFRYNSGGALSASAKLSSMVSGKGVKDVFCILEYNKIMDEGLREAGENYNKYYFEDDIEKGTFVNKLTGLNRLFVLTSARTASASEALINGLRVYMDNVILIGDVTYGKNTASITIYETDAEKQKTNKWGMQPIVAKITNADGFSDFGDGFQPDVEQFEQLPYLPLGDTSEDLLQAALIEMGIRQETPKNLRADRRNAFIPIFSSIDKTPVRRNLYINREKLRINRF